MTLTLPGRVLQTIRRRGLLNEGDVVLIAVSGGGDSVGLMHLLAELAPRLRLTLRVVSVDHGLRLESAEEVREVGEAAAALGLGFSGLRLRLGDGGNIQSRARHARYSALLSEAQTYSAKVALGHTLDDQAETVIGRILRGAGLRGLSGIQPERSDGVVRPLIDIRREEIRSYLRGRGVPWHDDPSNESTHFERVRIRRALRLFEDEDPQLPVHLGELADDAREADAALDELGRSLGPEISALAQAPSAVRRVVIRRLAEAKLGRGLRRRHLEDLEACVRAGSGEVLLGTGWRASVTDGELRFERGPWRGRSG